MGSKLELPTVVIHTKKEIMEIVVTKSLKKSLLFYVTSVIYIH